MILEKVVLILISEKLKLFYLIVQLTLAEAYSEPSRTFAIELFAKITTESR